jgi:L-gulonolactone oxidase
MLSPEDARRFYNQFWTALEKYDYRPHWGKYFAPAPTSVWRKRYEKWDEFLALRKKFDPEEIFLNKFWKHALDIS